MSQISAIPRAERIGALLRAHFAPTSLEVVDNSASHAGHTGARPGGETHYTVKIVTPAFAGLNRVARSRAVHAALAHEFATGLHALSLKLLAPNEA